MQPHATQRLRTGGHHDRGTLIAMALTAIAMSIPQGTSKPAATGMASRL